MASKSAIPDLDQHGLLPVGVHDCNFETIRGKFAYGKHRKDLLRMLFSFIRNELRPIGLQCPMYIDGSYTRRAASPADIDLVLDVSSCPDSHVKEVLMLFFLRRQQVKEEYKVDFWVKHPRFPNDLVSFFCYVGIKAGSELGLANKAQKGILRISL